MNLIVDGLNIAFRAHHIYDVKQGLKNSEGLPTGLIYGFLQILAKWRKKYPNHQITVVWDRPGGKEWRQAIVPSYKANRPSSSAPAPVELDALLEEPEVDIFSLQISLLHKILPSLGIDQVSAPEREADDVIAYLARDLFSDDSNIILTSDRDLLQLVTRTTILATPDDKFYDVDRVVDEYGVTPDKLVYLRAMFGDTSDNLPGIPRFRKKVAARLVTEYGDIDSIYSHNVKDLGLTKKETEKLVSNEALVRDNLRVMELVSTASHIDYNTGSYNEDEINTICDVLEFKKIRSRLLAFGQAQQGFLKCLISNPSTPPN